MLLNSLAYQTIVPHRDDRKLENNIFAYLIKAQAVEFDEWEEILIGEGIVQPSLFRGTARTESLESIMGGSSMWSGIYIANLFKRI